MKKATFAETWNRWSGKWPLQLLLNSVPMLCGLLLFPIGAWMTLCVYPVLHVSLCEFNARNARSVGRQAWLQLWLLASSELGVLLNTLLYFTVFGHDADGVAVAQLEAVIVPIVVAVMSLVALAVRAFIMEPVPRKHK